MRVLICLSLFLPASAFGADVWTDPHPGIRYLHRSTNEPKEIHALIIDLSRPEISLRMTRSSEKGRTPSSFASLVGAVAAVNADFYNTNGSFDPVGLAIGQGMVWSDDSAGHRFIACTGAKECSIDTTNQARAADPSWAGAVGGNTLLVNNGAVVQSAADDTACGSFCTTQHPRTAVGLSADRQTLILVVVEGRQTPILGMTTNRLAQLMLDLGADVALNLDGGGSSTMVLDGRRVSGRPSNEPNERPVANHIAILFDAAAATSGRLVGFIRENDIFDANAGLPGVSVSLSDGQMTTTDSRGYYEFAEVMPGDVTVTAALAGFDSLSEIKTIAAGTTNWKSMALRRTAVPPPDAGFVEPDAGFFDGGVVEPDSGVVVDPDAGVVVAPDAGVVAPDAGALAPDAGVAVVPEIIEEDGGCRVLGRSSGSVLILLALVFYRRRRSSS